VGMFDLPKGMNFSQMLQMFADDMEEFDKWLGSDAGKRARMEADEKYKRDVGEISATRTAAGEKYTQPYKPGTLDYATGIASLLATIAPMFIKPPSPGKFGRPSPRMPQYRASMSALQNLGGVLGQISPMRRENYLAGQQQGLKESQGAYERSMGMAGANYAGEIAGAPPTNEDKMKMLLPLLKMEGKSEKPPFTPYQQYQMGRNTEADIRRTQVSDQKNILAQANQITRPIIGADFVINSIEDLDEVIYRLESFSIVPSPIAMKQGGQTQAILQTLKNLRDKYYGGTTPMLPMGGGQPSLEEIEAELARRRIGGRP